MLKNKVKIMSAIAETVRENPAMMLVTLRFNTLDLKHIVATLERFNYKVVGRFEEATNEAPDMDRLNLLLKYIEL